MNNSKKLGHFIGQPVFSQILQHLLNEEIAKSVVKHGADNYVKKLDTRAHLVALLYGVITGSQSLREIELGLQAGADRLSHLGIDFKVCRSTLSDANNKRPCKVFESIYGLLYAKNRDFLSDSRLLEAESNKVFAID